MRLLPRFFSRDITEKKPETFQEELERQCGLLLLPLSILCLFVWFPFLYMDYQVIGGYNTGLVVIRVGLSIVSLLLIITYQILHNYGYWLLILLGLWILLGSGFAFVFSGGRDVYLAGYAICIAGVGFIPIRMVHGVAVIVSSMVLVFGLVFITGGYDLDGYERLYNLNNLGSATVLAFFALNILNRIRFRSYQKSKIIEAEQEKSESLLTNILPTAIAGELKTKGLVTPRKFDSASVLFTDFVGFTKISEEMSAIELVSELDKCFSYFDSVTRKYGVEKIKTIGDSYMLAGGIPNANQTHAVDCVLAAMEIQAFMDQLKTIKAAKGKPFWELRLGINTGSLVAGVIAEMKFSYDVWGDTVNIASRMESSGKVGRINISESTYSEVARFFECEYRGKVSAKNKGEINMYFVNKLRPEFADDPAGTVPNAEFYKAYKALAAGEA